MRCGAQIARRFESYTFDAWAKSLLDRFRLALPVPYRPTADYAVDTRFAYEQPLRRRLLLICGDTGVSAAKIHSLDVAKFFRQGNFGRAIDPATEPAPGTGLGLVRALWRSTLHPGVRSALPFQMIGALAELLPRINLQLLAALRATYRFVFLDEFQDTTGVQYRLMHTAFRGASEILTAVGDNKQRIMLWADAQGGRVRRVQKRLRRRPTRIGDELSLRTAAGCGSASPDSSFGLGKPGVTCPQGFTLRATARRLSCRPILPQSLLLRSE